MCVPVLYVNAVEKNETNDLIFFLNLMQQKVSKVLMTGLKKKINKNVGTFVFILRI